MNENDSCRCCVCKGNLEKCLSTPCVHHEDWIVRKLESDKDKILSIFAQEIECNDYERILAIINEELK